MISTRVVGALCVATATAVLCFGSATAIPGQTADWFDMTGVCDPGGNDALASVVSVHTRAVSDVDTRHDADLDESDVLFALALARHGIGTGAFGSIASFDISRTQETSLDTTTRVDRDGVLAAIALGVGGVSPADALACASDVRQDARIESDVEQRVSLDEDNVFLALALARNGDSSIELGDVADIDTDARFEWSFDRDVDVNRQDALLLLAFGR